MTVMKIGLITTLDTNIGDDFIRDGIRGLLSERYRGRTIEFVSVNKHSPFTVYPPWHPVHVRNLAGLLPLGRDRVRSAIERVCSRIGETRFDSCDLIVQCGAPVFWPECSASEWAVPLWHQVVGRLSSRIPVLNLAAGSCYPWERQPVKLEPEADAKYVRDILGYCRLTTVRDPLAERLCKSVGGDVVRLPCSAFLAFEPPAAREPEYVLVNYMPGGGHYEWDQGIDPSIWEGTVRRLVAELRKSEKVAFLCHDDRELALARALAPDLPAFLPRNSVEYGACIARAKFALCNRMHASVAMAGMGIPSIAVCTDTRLLMVAELGLPAYYVKDATPDLLLERTGQMLRTLDDERERLLTLQAQTRQGYLAALDGALSAS
ncbi:polysaccharide pyruvyl transferase family protein [Geomonas oryzisoli]|uniref:Polysaccharide pyruvyl transferase family protein n=1 Tax=Geomonas oryzisoli TaxID=2847992 RepID=A0ABX8JCD6_9BACT|nr:polysaccharide pyruvyl transferase family protein [Geomonas oryzisoli]QWV95072.1 polysaccharide pyruvyl transferase family protein [Geomonas oryzisoli]